MQLLVLLNFAAALQGIFLTYLIAHNRLKELKSVVLGTLNVGFISQLAWWSLWFIGLLQNLPAFYQCCRSVVPALWSPAIYLYFCVNTQQVTQYLLSSFPSFCYLCRCIYPFLSKKRGRKNPICRVYFFKRTCTI